MPAPQLTSDAEQDLTEAYDWYEEQEPGLGLQFLSSMDAAIQRASRVPQSGSVVDGLPVLRLLARRFPYAVYYKLDEATITVVAILHQRRDRPARVRRRLS